MDPGVDPLSAHERHTRKAFGLVVIDASRPVVVRATLRAKEGHGDDLDRELQAVAAVRAAEPGNVAFMVSRSVTDELEFELFEVYADAEAHAEHQRMARQPGDPHGRRVARVLESRQISRGTMRYSSITLGQHAAGSELYESSSRASAGPNSSFLDGRAPRVERQSRRLERYDIPAGRAKPYPLEGLRVIDLSRVLAGPYAGRLLSDLGADVVKVEGPDGDLSRLWGQVRNGMSGYYFQQNTGKRNVSLDLKNPAAIALLLDLAAEADVVIENFRPGVAERLGLGWRQLSERNPSLIMLSISGWGQSGPRSEQRAFAPIIHALTGVIDRQAREHGLPPTDPLMSMADFYAALHGVIAVLAALDLRTRTGQGQHVDMALFDAMLATDCYAHHFIDGHPFERLGGYIWEATGGPILIAGDYRHTWRQLRQAFALEDPAPPGADLETKVAARKRAIAEWMRAFSSRDLLLAALDHAGLIHSGIFTSEQAFASEDAAARRMVADVGDGSGGPRRVVQSPYRFSDASSGTTEPAPAYGEHNAAVLADWLNVTGTNFDALLQLRVFGPDRPIADGAQVSSPSNQLDSAAGRPT